MINTDNCADCVFPDGIDSRAFMSDTDLAHLDLLHQYQTLIRHRKYSEAARLLNHSDSFYYGAHLFNGLEDRLYRLGQYLTAKAEKEKLGCYQTEAPASPKTGMHWIS